MRVFSLYTQIFIIGADFVPSSQSNICFLLIRYESLDFMYTLDVIQLTAFIIPVGAQSMPGLTRGSLFQLTTEPF